MALQAIYQGRLQKIRTLMRRHNVDALFIQLSEADTDREKANMRYMAGFTGSTALGLITATHTLFFVDSRYTIQARNEVRSWELCENKGAQQLFAELSNLGIRRLGLIAEEMPYSLVLKLQEICKKQIEIVALPNIVRQVREIKTQHEVKCIARAISATEQALMKTYEAIRPGITELELARILFNALPFDAKLAWEPIIASGARSAEPHGAASSKALATGDIVQFDIGVYVNGYTSDISRVVVVGHATEKQKAMHAVVRSALECAMPFYKAGEKISDAAEAAHKTIMDTEFAEHVFQHGLGHGLGMEVHELPFFDSKDKNAVFKRGQVITNEPGIYIAGYGGMRIEEDILITATGTQILTTLTNDLLEL